MTIHDAGMNLLDRTFPRPSKWLDLLVMCNHVWPYNRALAQKSATEAWVRGAWDDDSWRELQMEQLKQRLRKILGEVRPGMLHQSLRKETLRRCLGSLKGPQTEGTPYVQPRGLGRPRT